MTRLYSPEGAIGQADVALAEMPTPLAGRRIAALDNGKPGAAWLLTHLGEQLAQRTGARFIGTSRKGSAATPCEDALVEALVSEADLILTGTAD